MTLELAADIPACLVDPAFFDVAILNLITNARDAMPEGGEIRVSTERVVQNFESSDPPGRETFVRVRARDSGQGMSPEVLRRVFDPFFTTKGEQGTGIGLPQVYAFTHTVGGHVSVTSKPGIGTTVDLVFPGVESQR